ncbi:hypothetical protein [Qipengyuania soli]|uniref:Uncharacterized protein n=1 Tax=Qipengyuania soli TaxID=2782568 RepID=A0A7S8F790_9SPHN|nr:hypothetical protein [Qipengyuania soli]QPD00289.1 hypothetical protein IRL76_07155 [Qipengyuania soli]
MKKLFFAGAAALAFTAIPAAAQDVAVDAEGNVYVLTEVQQSDYDGWPVERQTAYLGWPYGVQEYYWTLTPTQLDGWWVLTDPQRVSVYEMTPDQREIAWTQIAAQMNKSTTAAVATTAAASASTMQPRFVSNAVVQTTPAADTAATGDDLPVCTPKQQDNCINSWEKNKTGNRPLNYWPGRPASEISAERGTLPVNEPTD